MKRYAISLLCLCLVSWASLATAVQLPATGQTTCYDTAGNVINCAGTGQDGDKKAGAAWDAATRFTDNNNGTVTDNLTGLVWLKNANCDGTKRWADALTWSHSLASGVCDLTDGSNAGDWRLPNRKELQSLIDRSRTSPALPAGHPFTGVQSNYYWSSSTNAGLTGYAWRVDMDDGDVYNVNKSNYSYYVWPVRAGQ